MTSPSTLLSPGVVRLERLLPGPVDRVWDYLVDSEKRATWLAAGEWDLRVGGAIRMTPDNNRLSRDKNAPEAYRKNGGKVVTGVITRLEPKRLVAHTWTWQDLDSEVTYELTPRGKDVLLVIVHRALQPRQVVLGVMAGWDVHTGILEDVLRGVEPRPYWAEWAKLEKQYSPAVP